MLPTRTLVPATLLTLATAVSAQTAGGSADNRWTFYASSSSGYDFARTMDTISDLNGDGVPELLVGEPFATYQVHHGGAATILSGSNGSILHRHHGAASERLGQVVSAAGHLDADGVEDYLYLVHRDALTFGPIVYGMSGATHQELFRLPLLSHGDCRSLAPAGDVDGDGVDDLLVGATNVIELFSGATQASLLRIYEINVDLGFAVRGIGDQDGDGKPDILAGAPRASAGMQNSGAVRIYSSATGAILLEVSGRNSGASFGCSVAAAGDMDGDGFEDFVAGGYGTKVGNLQMAGIVQLCSGATGAVLWEVEGDQGWGYLGENVEVLGDADGDGVPDVSGGAPRVDNAAGTLVGRISFYSGVDGREFWRDEGTSSRNIGALLVAAGDQGLVPCQFSYAVEDQQIRTLAYEPHLYVEALELSVSSGVSVRLKLDFPNTLRDKAYAVLASAGGTGPTTLGGIEVPLTDGPMLQQFVSGWTPVALLRGRGTLNVHGEAVAEMVGAPGLAAYLGSRIWLAAVCYDRATGVGIRSSVPHGVTIVP